MTKRILGLAVFLLLPPTSLVVWVQWGQSFGPPWVLWLLGSIGTWTAFWAGVAQISGYSLRDFVARRGRWASLTKKGKDRQGDGKVQTSGDMTGGLNRARSLVVQLRQHCDNIGAFQGEATRPLGTAERVLVQEQLERECEAAVLAAQGLGAYLSGLPTLSVAELSSLQGLLPDMLCAGNPNELVRRVSELLAIADRYLQSAAQTVVQGEDVGQSPTAVPLAPQVVHSRSVDVPHVQQELARKEELLQALDKRLHELRVKKAKMGSIFSAGEAVELREAEQDAQELQEQIEALKGQLSAHEANDR